MKKAGLITLLLIISTACVGCSDSANISSSLTSSLKAIVESGKADATSSSISFKEDQTTMSQAEESNVAETSSSALNFSSESSTNKTSSKVSSNKTFSQKQQGIDDPDSENFDPYHKEGYVYIPGEGYVETGGEEAPSGEEAMNGEDFWDILNDPNNEKVGY